MLVLDTDIVSLLQHPESDIARRLTARITASGEPTAVTIVTIEEQFRGRLAGCAKARTPDQYSVAAFRLRRLLTEYQSRIILDFDAAAAAEFRRLKGLKIRVGTMDLRIAAITLANAGTLVTRNLSDFSNVPSLRAEDWSRED